MIDDDEQMERLQMLRFRWQDRALKARAELVRLQAEVERLQAHLAQEHSSEDSYMALQAEVADKDRQIEEAASLLIDRETEIERLRKDRTSLLNKNADLTLRLSHRSAEVERRDQE